MISGGQIKSHHITSTKSMKEERRKSKGNERGELEES